MSITCANVVRSCQRRSGQSRFGQRVKTPVLTVGVSQNGQRSGGRGGGARSGRSAACGAGEIDLRDHVAGAQDDHVVAGPDVLAREVLLVVQRRGLDRDAADVHRLERRERVQVAELADVPVDRVQPRDRGRGRELPGDRPARVAPDHAEPALQLDVVDLHHDAVDLEVERAAALLPVQALRDDLVLGGQLLDVAVDPEAVLAQPLQRRPVRAQAQALGDADPVAPHRQRALGGRARGRAAGSSRRRCCAGS